MGILKVQMIHEYGAHAFIYWHWDAGGWQPVQGGLSDAHSPFHQETLDLLLQSPDTGSCFSWLKIFEIQMLAYTFSNKCFMNVFFYFPIHCS